MKRLSPSLFTTILALSVSGRLAAADPESSFGLAPSAAPQLQPAQAPAGLPLIPDAMQPADKTAIVPPPPQVGGDKTSLSEDRLRRQIQLRQAKTKAERDPALQAIMAKALVAKTDFEQRKLFIDYYNLFCDLVAKADKTIKKEDIAAMRTAYTGRFYQSRIVPTVDPATFRKSN